MVHSRSNTQFDCTEVSANLKQGAHVHQPTADAVSQARVQPYDAASGNHRQLFPPYWGPPAWQRGGKTRVSITSYCRAEYKAVYQAPAPHNTCGSCWLRTAPQFYHDMRGEGESRVTSKLKQGAHIHQPTAWSLPHARVQRYYAGSGSYGQLFRHYWGSPAWHSRRSVTGENLCISCRGESFKCQHHTTHVGDVAGNRTVVLPRHARGRRIKSLVYVCPLL